MRIGKRHIWVLAVGFSIALIVLIQVLRHSFSETERKARIRIRETFEKKYPEYYQLKYAVQVSQID